MRHFNLILIGLMVISCSKVDQFEDKTDSMEKKTAQMSVTTDDMKKLTEDMYIQIRSKESEETRTRKLQAMQEAKGMGIKIASAAAYFKSFEFQLWTNSPAYDDEHAKEALLLSAANEFTRTMTDLYAKLSKRERRRMSPTKAGVLNQEEMDFYAIAATMHLNHEYQEDMIKQNKTSKLSMYEMVKRALINDNNGQRLESYQEVLVSGMNKEIMIALFKARVDILAALGLKNLTDKRDMTTLQKFEGLIFILTNGFLGAVNLPETYSKSNDATKKFATTYLEAAVKTRQLLQELSYPKHPEYAKNLEKTLKSAFEHIEMKTLNEEESALIFDDKKEEIRMLVNKLL